MTKLAWDTTGTRFYETGVDHGVLYRRNVTGAYDKGYPWNGLISMAESPSGAEANPQYADNIKYLNLISAEEYGGTIEAFTFPDEFAECDGTASPTKGLTLGQQERKSFGLSYRTKLGNDIDGQDHGYKLHLVYEALAAPTEKTYTTVNESPEAMTFSWSITTTKVDVPGYKPTALLTIDSTQFSAEKMAELENILYGTPGTDPRLPFPEEIIAILSGNTVEVMPVAPTYDAATDTITVPTVAGVVYQINGETVTGNVVITEDTMVNAVPSSGYRFPEVSDSDWFFDHS